MKTTCNFQSIQFSNVRKPFIGFSILVFFLFQLTSCVNKGGTEGTSQRFSKDLDTSYKENSTEIESITRTFYNYEDGSNSAKLTHVIGDTSYAYVIQNDSEFSLVTFSNENELKKFFSDMRTVANNPKKPLKYNFGALQNGNISSSGDDIHLFIHSSISAGKAVSLDIKKSEIDSLESCYNRYLKEKTKK